MGVLALAFVVYGAIEDICLGFRWFMWLQYLFLVLYSNERGSLQMRVKASVCRVWGF